MNISLQKFLLSGISIWLVVTMFGVYFIFGLKENLNFGVDLVGGTFITLEVDLEKAVEIAALNKGRMFAEKLKKENFDAPTSVVAKKNRVVLSFSGPEMVERAHNYFATADFFEYSGRVENSTIVLSLKKKEIEKIQREALLGNVEVLEKRLNPTGTSEISIVSKGKKNILVELPNVHDVNKARNMIGRTALLEFKPVIEQGNSEDEILQSYPDEKLPEDLMIVKGSARAGGKAFFVVPKFASLTGSMLKDAKAGIGGDLRNQPAVDIEFKPEGADKFYELTSQNVGKQVAILLDNVVISAPRVNEPLRQGRAQISGSFTTDEAKDLAAVLKSGAFLAPVKFEEERHIGPSLGKQSIRNGLLACLLGIIALFFFALFVYKLAGLLAFLVLIYNLLLILFALAWFGATLTLPGIAGMLLTVGMAIDSSILIFERIKEELATGLSLKKAVNLGFSGAIKVILDANITHFLVSIVLYYLGTGPIRGFAVTMIIGIISTLITGVIMLKTVFNFLIDGLGVRKISF